MPASNLPPGVTGGEDQVAGGNFSPFSGARSRKVALIVPPEFVALCKGRKVDPDQVLRGFIADLVDPGFAARNRFRQKELAKRGYSTNGSDERELARHYFDRAHPDWGTEK